MSQDSRIAILENRITRFYESYLLKKLVFAVLLFGIFTFGAAFSIFVLSQNLLFAALGFALIGLVSINLAMLFVVPTSQQLEQSKGVIFGALEDRSRIKNFDVKSVKLVDEQGEAVVLKGADLRVWKNFVVPFLVTHPSIVAESGESVGANDSGSAFEIDADDRRQREMEALEQKIRAELKELEVKREAIKTRVEELAEAEERARKMLYEDAESVEEADSQESPELSASIEDKQTEAGDMRQRIKAERKQLEAEAVEVARSTKSLAKRLDDLSESGAS